MVDTNFQTAPVPDGGWTFETLSETIRINGKSITLPFCIDQLGEDYVFDEASQVGTTCFMGSTDFSSASGRQP